MVTTKTPEGTSRVWNLRHVQGHTAQCTVTRLSFGTRRWAFCFAVNDDVAVEWFPSAKAALRAASATVHVMLSNGWRCSYYDGRSVVADIPPQRG